MTSDQALWLVTIIGGVVMLLLIAVIMVALQESARRDLEILNAVGDLLDDKDGDR